MEFSKDSCPDFLFFLLAKVAVFRFKMFSLRMPYLLDLLLALEVSLLMNLTKLSMVFIDY